MAASLLSEINGQVSALNRVLAQAAQSGVHVRISQTQQQTKDHSYPVLTATETKGEADQPKEVQTNHAENLDAAVTQTEVKPSPTATAPSANSTVSPAPMPPQRNW